MNRISFLYYFLVILFSLTGCEFDPGNEGYIPPVFSPPNEYFVESISKSTVKISWSKYYTASVIVERSEYENSQFMIIQPNVMTNYFIDSNLDEKKLYYYRFRGFTSSDTSYFSSLRIGIDSTSRLLQSIETNKYSNALSLSDDGTRIIVSNGELGKFEVRQYSDLTLLTNQSLSHGSIGAQPRFSSDSKKVIGANGQYGLSITLSPYSETSLTVPDSFTIYDIFYFDQDKKVIALAQHNKGLYSTAFVFDLPSDSVVQKFDSLGSIVYYSSMISSDRKKILFRTYTGLYIFDTSPTFSIRFFPFHQNYNQFVFLKDSSTILGIKYNEFNLLNSQSGEIIRTVKALNSYGGRAVIYSSEQKIIFFSYAHEVNICDLRTGLLEQRAGNIALDKYITGVVSGKNEDSFLILYTDGTLNRYSTVEFTKQWQKKY